MNPAQDPQVRAAVLASVTDAELRELLAANVTALATAADVVLSPILAECPSTLAAWQDYVEGRRFPRLVNEDRRSERNNGGVLYPRAVCPGCEQRVPVVVRRDESLTYRAHGPCPSGRDPVDPARVVGWGTFQHLAPAG